MLSRKQYFIKSAFGGKTTADGGQKFSSLNDVAVSNSVFPMRVCVCVCGGGGGGLGGRFAKKILENYRNYNTSPGFDDTFIVIIFIMKFAHHIKK